MSYGDMAEGRRTGLWLIGACGSVATCAVCGLAALRAGLTDATGCVTGQLDPSGSVFPGWTDLVIGGHDIAPVTIGDKAAQLTAAGLLPKSLLPLIEDDLKEANSAIRTGYDGQSHGRPQAEAADRLTAEITEFREANELTSVVVVNVAATEAPVLALPEHADLESLTRALADPRRQVLTPTSLAIYAAFRADCAVVDFTPSPGLRMPAITELARQRRLPYAGCDGKTGETLLRTVLAPMFAERALRVRSWSGINLLGGGDGANLADPERAKGKLTSKARGLAAMLGSDVTAPLHIDYVPDLADRKVAWDYVSFEGFLGARMSLQFTWDGYDSALAAPLVLDLARLVAGAHRAGESGPLGALGFFFKDPLGATEHRFAQQARELSDWIRQLMARPGNRTSA